MEDRVTPGLYLEMTDVDAARYAAERVPAVLAHPGVTRATWWENVRRDRDDLPRVLPEFGLLGVFEVDDGFTPPPCPDHATGHHFRRTGRPGQGRLTGRPTVGLSLVLISPSEPAQAQALRDWGDFVHIRHIAEVAVPGYSMITPYEHADGGDPRFLHCYEMDTDDPEASFQAMTPLVRAALPDRAAFRAWARHEALCIQYVNSFRRVGVRAPVTDFFEVVHAQRACRAFDPAPLDDATVARVLDAATFAPSAENRQPWVFVVVRDPARRDEVHDLTQRAWEGGGRDFATKRLTPGLLADVERGVAGGGYRSAPVLVVVAADMARCHPATVAESIFPAVQNLCLAAQALGLGSALTTLTTTFAAELGSLVDLPDHVEAQAVVPLGHPARPLGPPRREPFAEHTHRDRFGQPW